MRYIATLKKVFSDINMDTIGARIEYARKTAGFSRDKVGADCAISRSTLQLYESDKRQPSIKFLQDLAGLTSQSFLWLATGEETPVLDESLLQTIVETVETYLDDNDEEIEPNKKAQLYVKLYNKYAGQSTTAEQQTAEIIDLVELLAA